jgi:hypothetical protein
VVICAVCGNETKERRGICRYCGTAQEPQRVKGPLHKTVNLEKGRPYVERAIKKLKAELEAAKIERVRVLTIIHGYGSSGKGGAIKDECRKYLDYLSSIGEIKEYVAGEEFSRRSGRVKSLLGRFPGLAAKGDLDRRNPGVTLVIM